MPHPARMLTYQGQTKKLMEWAAIKGLPPSTVKHRLDVLGWSIERALETLSDARRLEPDRPNGSKIPIPPRPRLHRASNRAYVWHLGKARYLGEWNSPEAAAAYERFLQRWRAEPKAAAAVAVGEHLTIMGLTVAYMKWAATEFVKFGRQTSEVSCRRIACRVLNSLYADVPAQAFTPNMLEACQRKMIADQYARTSINLHTWRIRDIWRWAVKADLVPVVVWQALATVGPVRVGKGAVERKRVRPVPEPDFLATVARLQEPYRTIAKLHRLMGCRSGEICGLRVGEIDRCRGDEWRYEVRQEINKQAVRERDQVYWLGPRCQELLLPYLAGKGDEDYLFAPRRLNGRFALAHITPDLYREKVAQACKLAGVAHWWPHRLRHSKATEVRAGYGAEAVKAVIGDTTDKMADRYAERNEDLARRIARETA